MGEKFQQNEIARVQKLLSQGIPLKKVVEHVGGHSYGSWSVTISNIRNGKRKNSHRRILRRLAYAEELFRLGAIVKELEEPFCMKADSLRMFFWRHGLDRKQRELLRKKNVHK